MTKVHGEVASLTALHEQSLELSRHARQLQKEFTQLQEASKLLRLESMQLRDDIRILRRKPSTDYTELICESVDG